MDKVYGQAMHEKTPDDANPSTRNHSPSAKVEVQMQVPREYTNFLLPKVSPLIANTLIRETRETRLNSKRESTNCIHAESREVEFFPVQILTSAKLGGFA